MASPLEAEIRGRIEASGPMSIADYMQTCLAHPEHGYYATRDPLGQAGDFTTAPEISQMFGELLGLWAADVWQRLGQPAAINLVELGPGRGTMMADMLRAANALPAFKRAISVHLVETSATLRARQRDVLGENIAWHDSLGSVPDAPAIYVANEFFDALPIHQAIRRADGWRERTVDIGRDDQLRFGIAQTPCDSVVPTALRDAPIGSVYEWRDLEIARDLATRAVRQGAALIIDYGHADSAIGDTLQAVRAHSFHPPLVDPGMADLTAHVDFAALGAAAVSTGARVYGPIEQAMFLRRLGIEQRAAMLKSKATEAQARDIDAALDRLTATTPAGMGKMFKVLGLASTELRPLAGFDG